MLYTRAQQAENQQKTNSITFIHVKIVCMITCTKLNLLRKGTDHSLIILIKMPSLSKFQKFLNGLIPTLSEEHKYLKQIFFFPINAST